MKPFFKGLSVMAATLTIVLVCLWLPAQERPGGNTSNIRANNVVVTGGTITVSNSSSDANFKSYSLGVRNNGGGAGNFYVERTKEDGTKIGVFNSSGTGNDFYDCVRFNGGGALPLAITNQFGAWYIMIPDGAGLANLAFTTDGGIALQGTNWNATFSGTGDIDITDDRGPNGFNTGADGTVNFYCTNIFNFLNYPAAFASFSVGPATNTLVKSILSTNATLNFASTAGSLSTDVTVPLLTVGTNSDWAVTVTPQRAVMAGFTNGTFMGWVSATNTISIRFANNAISVQDPPSGKFLITATQVSP